MKKFLGIITNVSKYPSAEKPTSLWLGEAVHFAHEVEKAGYAVDYASHKGTYTPIDPNDYAGGHGAVWDFPDNALTQVAHLQPWRCGVLVCHGSARLLNIEQKALQLDKLVPYLTEDALVARGLSMKKRQIGLPLPSPTSASLQGKTPLQALQWRSKFWSCSKF